MNPTSTIGKSVLVNLGTHVPVLKRNLDLRRGLSRHSRYQQLRETEYLYSEKDHSPFEG